MVVDTTKSGFHKLTLQPNSRSSEKTEAPPKPNIAKFLPSQDGCGIDARRV